jgi:steroid delta-isomerase-like uncharacterized protein
VRESNASNPNVGLARRWFEEVWNQRRTETIDELLTPESVGHMEGGDAHGIDGFKRAHAAFVAAFPDLRLSIEALMADGDQVAIRWRATGCHAGDGLGACATHEVVSFRGITWQRYRDGKLVEGWDCWDQTALAHHLRDADHRRRSAGADPT